jgi:hypothetical protein
VELETTACGDFSAFKILKIFTVKVFVTITFKLLQTTKEDMD